MVDAFVFVFLLFFQKKRENLWLFIRDIRNYPDGGTGFWFEASDILVVFELKTEIVSRVVTLKIVMFFGLSTTLRIVLDLRLSDSPFSSQQYTQIT